jgi:DNA-binding CsgD family transcriptional regulator
MKGLGDRDTQTHLERPGFFSGMGTALAGMRRGQEGLSLGSIRWNRSFYVLAYTFELLFYARHSTWLHTDTSLFGIDSGMLMYVGHILMSLIVMLLWTPRFKRLIRISLAVTLLGFFAFLSVPEGIARLLFAVITMAGLGGCVTSARCGFAFAANNTERLLGVVLALSGRSLMQFIDAIFPDGMFWDTALFRYVLPLICLAGLSVCLLRFNESDLEVKEEVTPGDRRGLYWAFAIFIAYFAIEGYTPFMENDAFAYRTLFNGLGQLVAVALFVLILVLLKKNICHIWNTFFCVCLVAAVLAAFVHEPVLDVPLHLMVGVTDIGWIAALYMLACAQRRFASYRLLKQCTLIFVVISPLTTLSDELAEALFPQAVSQVTLVFVLVVAIAFLMTVPYSYKHLFSAAWLPELYTSDMELLREKVIEADRLERYKLTRRETEVVVLLLAAYTGRMIAGELSIAEPTAKMHISNAYRKMGINSRAELFRMFGVLASPHD